MNLVLSFFLVCINLTVYKILAKYNSLKQNLLFAIFFIVIMIIFLKIFGIIRNSNRDEGYAFFVLLNFSWVIIWLNLFKKIINSKVDISEELNLNEYLPSNTYLITITTIITLFQLVMILSGKLYELKINK